MQHGSDERLALPIEEAVLLWSIRVWVIGLRHDIEASRRIEDMMTRLGAHEATPYLDGFMFAISHGATRKIAIHCTCYPKVGEDERILLDVFRMAQECRLFEALLLLRGMTSDTGARAALRSAKGLATEFSLRAVPGRTQDGDTSRVGQPSGLNWPRLQPDVPGADEDTHFRTFH